jgi:hypothetical protein
MATAKGRGKTVLGLFVDGLDVKLAHLSVQRKHIVIEELKTATLVTKLHDRKLVEEGAGSVQEGSDAFRFRPPPADVGGDGNGSRQQRRSARPDRRLSAAKYSLTYSLPSPRSTITLLESDFRAEGRSLAIAS